MTLQILERDLESAQAEHDSLESTASDPKGFAALASAGARLAVLGKRLTSARADAARDAASAATAAATAERAAAVKALHDRQAAASRTWGDWSREMESIESRLLTLWQTFEGLQRESSDLAKSAQAWGENVPPPDNSSALAFGKRAATGASPCRWWPRRQSARMGRG